MAFFDTNPSRYTRTKPSFARWLLEQKARDGGIGELARAAATDRGYPSEGDFKAVSKRLNELGATPEMHIALEEAQIDWAAY
ncbi:hypothetical protein [Sphingomonas cavernae]|uniref:YozE SAM-like domain-containing protein n=1 Tax=Sphingomonas cavernae TaxID=2320861 RepID=A0A418WMC8_9SPHN|nr:hypothetical protein [Sphingomonas cavernae]RJF91150.1 hypothetical protein D3876_13545 [Sphingomonas cavernae]